MGIIIIPIVGEAHKFYNILGEMTMKDIRSTKILLPRYLGLIVKCPSHQNDSRWPGWVECVREKQWRVVWFVLAFSRSHRPQFFFPFRVRKKCFTSVKKNLS